MSSEKDAFGLEKDEDPFNKGKRRLDRVNKGMSTVYDDTVKKMKKFKT